jgi:hypothetical protein
MRHTDPSKHRCPRCEEIGDPRTCNCIRMVKRRLSEVRRRLKLGEPIRAAGELHEAERLLELLALDAQKDANGGRQRTPGYR